MSNCRAVGGPDLEMRVLTGAHNTTKVVIQKAVTRETASEKEAPPEQGKGVSSRRDARRRCVHTRKKKKCICCDEVYGT